jgi:ApaG protein
MPKATTDGVAVEVKSTYLEHQSMPDMGRFVFAYNVTITNNGADPVQLRSRHWVITDSLSQVREVRGPGVVGEQPLLRPGESFSYSSGSIIPTQWGTMHGEYIMERADGSTFEATIPSFMLMGPGLDSDFVN